MILASRGCVCCFWYLLSVGIVCSVSVKGKDTLIVVAINLIDMIPSPRTSSKTERLAVEPLYTLYRIVENYIQRMMKRDENE